MCDATSSQTTTCWHPGDPPTDRAAIYEQAVCAPQAALEGLLFDGMTILSGGCGLSDNSQTLMPQILRAGTRNLTIFSNNAVRRRA